MNNLDVVVNACVCVCVLGSDCVSLGHTNAFLHVFLCMFMPVGSECVGEGCVCPCVCVCFCVCVFVCPCASVLS